ncbi:MAG: hypothetical protein QF464_13155, partial [Myxococcota bacterium]|nr:hypothetical protein [Myxococcota bacterium]
EDNGESAALFVDSALGFSLGVPTDRGDLLTLGVLRPTGPGAAWEEVQVISPYEGVAMQRNTPRFRRFLGIIQHILDRCDPISFAHHLFVDPLPGHEPTDILYEFALGDETVPISSGVQVALATGLFGAHEADWRPALETLIAQGMMLGSDYDVDDLLGDNPSDAPALGPLEPIDSSAGGISSARFADVDGHHEWIIDVDPEAEFDRATYSQHQVVLYHWSGGAHIVDDLCIDEPSCPIVQDPSGALP